ncbi:MAG: class I SAM-dependent methyltransferase [Kiritimatiellae bacterium]|nr:class I SAM-dependent methyltransferase [Kiritimatiellia bacterium]
MAAGENPPEGIVEATGEPLPRWVWDEGEPVNRDFTSEDEVARYDAFHARFRDIGCELARLEAWFLEDGTAAAPRLGEFGCGTGRFVLRMAPKCAEMWVVDLSAAMLRLTAAQARAAGIRNARFRRGTFLTYRHDGGPLDGWNCSLALHHLPDAWKFEALRRLAGWTRTGGKLALTDVVWPDDGPMAGAGAWQTWLHARGGETLARDLEGHSRKEFSTLDWIMRGLLERAGWTVERLWVADDGVVRTFFCKKN